MTGRTRGGTAAPTSSTSCPEPGCAPEAGAGGWLGSDPPPTTGGCGPAHSPTPHPLPAAAPHNQARQRPASPQTVHVRLDRACASPPPVRCPTGTREVNSQRRRTATPSTVSLGARPTYAPTTEALVRDRPRSRHRSSRARRTPPARSASGRSPARSQRPGRARARTLAGSRATRSRPVRPRYMGFLLIELAPVVTRTEAFVGSKGSIVVPLRRKLRAEAPASANEAAAVAPAAAARAAVGGCASLVSAR